MTCMTICQLSPLLHKRRQALAKIVIPSSMPPGKLGPCLLAVFSQHRAKAACEAPELRISNFARAKDCPSIWG